MKAKEGLVSLDDMDWRILRILQANGKETFTEIGRQLNVAHSTVYDHIKKMESHGVIKKYTIVIDFGKCGVKFLTAILAIYTDPKKSEDVATQLAEHKQVSEVFISLSEELLINAKVTAKDQEELHAFIARFVAPMSGVLRVRTSIVTRKLKEESFPF
jgi:DNA-binding Lrp family transcriptional regulator